MNYDDLVSVIIPTYNRKDTIINCLESVFNQSYSNIEVIVIDDCSTDDTYKVIRDKYGDKVIYHRFDTNRKACYARNYGVSISKGSIIAFQDSDDLWHKDKLLRQVEVLKEDNSDFVFCGFNRILLNGEIFYFPTYQVDVDHDFFMQVLTENCIGTPTMVMKRSVFEATKFDESLKRYQDWDFAIRVARNYKVSYINEALMDSPVQENSITSTVNNYVALKCIFDKYYDDIIKDNKCLAHYYTCFGDCFRKTETKKAAGYYAKSNKCKLSIRTMIKYLFSSLGIKF